MNKIEDAIVCKSFDFKKFQIKLTVRSKEF